MLAGSLNELIDGVFLMAKCGVNWIKYYVVIVNIDLNIYLIMVA